MIDLAVMCSIPEVKAELVSNQIELDIFFVIK